MFCKIWCIWSYVGRWNLGISFYVVCHYRVAIPWRQVVKELLLYTFYFIIFLLLFRFLVIFIVNKEISSSFAKTFLPTLDIKWDIFNWGESFESYNLNLPEDLSTEHRTFLISLFYMKLNGETVTESYLFIDDFYDLRCFSNIFYWIEFNSFSI
jgi:hypothetical protein